jgi:hypothetical protein
MKTKLFSIFSLFILAFGALAPVPPAQAKAEAPSVAAEAVSPAGMLNPDGTLNLEQGFSGALDIEGYNVVIDPKRGPVFGPAGSAPAAVTPGDWAAIGDGGGVVDAYVRAIVVNGSDVYVGGDFTDLANIPAADYIAKWDGASWSALGSNNAGEGSLNSGVTTMAFSGSDLYVGGNFTQILQSTLVSGAAFVAKWDTLTGNWSALGNNGAGGGSLNSGVNKLVVNGSSVYVAGYFTNVNNGGTVLGAADFIAQWDSLTGNWSALGSNGAGDGAFPSTTYMGALAFSGANLYVGGSFTDVNNGGVVLTAADNVAKWDSLTGNWSALGSNGAGGGSISGTVYSLLVDGSDVYVGGEFTDVNNNGAVITQADYIAKWNAQTGSWSALGSNGGSNGPLNTYPTALFMNGTNLYVGGSFRNVNNNGVLLPSADCLAKWDTLTGNWSAIGSNGANDGAIPNKSYPSVLALAMQGNNLIAGGNFFDVNDAGNILPQADYLAQWDGSHWSSLGADANGALVNGYASSQVRAIAVMGADIYVGGIFSNVSNHGINLPEADYIAKWDGVNWSALGNNGGGNGSVNNYVYALAVSGTDLYVGGRFTNVNNNGVSLPAADYIAKWDSLTGNWSALGSNGANNGSLSSGGYVGALLVNNGSLYVGGNFTNVNNGGAVVPEADYIARWNVLAGNWSALGSNGAGDGALNAYVSALAADASDKLYVGGGFTNAATLPAADYLAAWDGMNWSALGDNNAGDGSLNNSVIALAVSGSNVYAGGIFSNVNNHGSILNAADLVAKWDGANWSALGNNGANNGVLNGGNSVNALVVDGADVYVGGWFRNIQSNSVILPSADHIAKWDSLTGTWSALGDNGAGDGSLGLNSTVYALTMNGNDLLVGGWFSNVNNNGTVLKEADYLAAYGAASSTPDTTPPTVLSVTRTSPNPTGAPSVDFKVTFSEDIYFPWPSVFVVSQSGVNSAKVTGWTGSGSVYTFHVSTGIGSGSIRLDVVDDDTIVDAAGNPLGGVGAGNGDYTGGEAYAISKVTLFLPLVLR